MACLVVWGCAASHPEKEVTAAFRALLADAKAGSQERVLAAAPFLASVSDKQREAVMQTFQRLARSAPGTLVTEVSRGAGGTYMLRAHVPDGKGDVVLPFVRNGQGRWEVSPVVTAVQHIDVVPATGD